MKLGFPLDHYGLLIPADQKKRISTWGRGHELRSPVGSITDVTLWGQERLCKEAVGFLGYICALLGIVVVRHLQEPQPNNLRATNGSK